MLHLIPAHPGLPVRAVAAIGPEIPLPPVPRLAQRHTDFVHGLALSQPGHQVRPWDSLVSGILHGAFFLVAAQVAATSADRVLERVRAAEHVVFLSPAAVEPRNAPEPVRPASPARTESSARAAAVARGFQTVPLVRSVAAEIPAITLKERPLDPRDYSGFGVEGGIADGVEGGLPVTEVPGSPAPADRGDGGTVVRMDAATTPARLIAIPAVSYPPTLVTLQLEGSVVLRFVIDTMGLVEPASIRVVHSKHALFEAAARRALEAARFVPARVGTGKVRQLTEQRFDFSLTDGR
jgi:TonB family protein